MDSTMTEASSGAELGPLSALPSSTTTDVPQDEFASLSAELNKTAIRNRWHPFFQEASKDPDTMTAFLSTVLVHLVDSSPKEASRFIEDFNQNERREFEDGIRISMESGDWTDLITHPKLQKRNLPPRPLPLGIVKDRARKVTPSKALELDALQPHIRTTLDIIRPRIENFLKNPELPDWVPPSTTNSGVYEFLRNLRIPAYPNRKDKPSLLYHNLHTHDDDVVFDQIFGRDYVFVCNTSGSGKTRRILEGLTKSWGLYFVAARDHNGVGVNDLEIAMNDIGQYEDWTDDIRRYVASDRAVQNKINIHISKRAIQKVLAARIVVFRLFLQLAKIRDGHIGLKHQRLWLLFQLSNPLPGFVTSHPFVTMKECLDRASSGALTILIKGFEQIRTQYFPESRFTIALDEAQQAVRLHRFCFLSSGEPAKFRSILCEIVNVFSTLAVKVIVSGTGLSLDEVEDALNSSVGKPLGHFETFVELGVFDDQEMEATLQRYIPSPILESPSGRSLRTRIREYLPGRYRFLISFLEFFLRNGLKSPHTLLNRYIAQYIDCSPGDMDFYVPFASREPQLEIEPMVRNFDWERLRENSAEIREIALIIQSHLLKKSTPTFGPLAHKYVEYGIAHLRKDHRGEILEPLVFLSIVRWFEKQDLCLETYLRHPLAEEEFRAYACEWVVILFLLRTFRRPTALTDVFKFHGAVPEWSDELVQIVGRIEGKEVAVNVLENPTRYPSLGVVYYAETIEDIIQWFEQSPAPSVLVPTHLFGPDVIIKCSGGLHLMGQTKSYLKGNINELGATTTWAINSLNSAKWFITVKSQLQKQKLIDTIEKFCILRFLAGYPLPANLDLAAESVKKALLDLGPVPLATISLDTFRGKFILPGEAKNVLEPMEHALARKRGLD